MVTPGHERWHPNPDFYYLPGGGPLLDMGPYYVTALVTLLGPVVSVIGAASHPRPESRHRLGAPPGRANPRLHRTHVTRRVDARVRGAVHPVDELRCGRHRWQPTSRSTARTARWLSQTRTSFDGDVRLRTLGSADWQTLPVSAGYLKASRGVGLEDLANTPRGVEPRAGGQLALHVLEILESLLVAAHKGTAVAIESRCERPAPVTEGNLLDGGSLRAVSC